MNSPFEQQRTKRLLVAAFAVASTWQPVVSSAATHSDSGVVPSRRASTTVQTTATSDRRRQYEIAHQLREKASPVKSDVQHAENPGVVACASDAQQQNESSDEEQSAIGRSVHLASKISSFKDLAPNWNGYGAPAFDDGLLEDCIRMAYLPVISGNRGEVFATGRGTVQFEMSNGRGYEAELEVYSASEYELLLITPDEEYDERRLSSLTEVIQTIDEFLAAEQSEPA